MPRLERPGGHIHYEVGGRGTALVLGHSFLCSGEMWAPVLERLEASSRVVNVDARGHGRSAPIRQRWEMADALADAVAVLDELGVERAVWGGLSMGGMVALQAAVKVPERVSGLILLDTDAAAERPFQRIQYQFLAQLSRAVGVQPLLPFVSKKMFGATTLGEAPELVAAWNRRFAAMDRLSIVRTVQALVRRPSLVDRLPEIRVPALVIVGAEDRSLPPPLSERLAAGLPDAALHVVPRCGHLSVLERPAEVGDLMGGFLERWRA